MLDNIKFLAWYDYAGLNLNEQVKPKKKRKMKRQILFRGWSELHNRWVEGNYVVDAIGGSRIVKPDSSGQGLTFIPVHPDSVGQFTGKTDVNLNSIFEEMTVYLIDDKGKSRKEYIVKFHEGSFCLFHLPDYMNGQRWGSLSRVSELGWHIEITGNTFNPDKA